MAKKNEAVIPEDQENTEEIQKTEDKVPFGKKVKTAAENVALDVSLFWQRNKKKMLVGAGILAGAAVGVLGLKTLSENGDILCDEDGEMVYESDDSEITEEAESEPTVGSEDE